MERKIFEQQIQDLSDEELGRSINKMIKTQSQVPDGLVNQWTRQENQRKLDFMVQDWERRAKESRNEIAKLVAELRNIKDIVIPALKQYE